MADNAVIISIIIPPNLLTNSRRKNRIFTWYRCCGKGFEERCYILKRHCGCNACLNSGSVIRNILHLSIVFFALMYRNALRSSSFDFIRVQNQYIVNSFQRIQNINSRITKIEHLNIKESLCRFLSYCR
jgi:hypothetical protein